MKKVLAVICALFLVCSFAVTAFADTANTPTVLPETPAPQLTVSSYASMFYNWEAGSTGNSVFLMIQNISSADALNVTATLSAPAQFRVNLSPFSMFGMNLSAGKSSSIPFTVDVAPTTPAGTYTLNATVSYRDASGKFYSSSGTVTVTVTNNTYFDGVALDSVSFAKESILAGEEAVLTFNLKNTGNFSFSDVKVSLDGFKPPMLVNKNPDQALIYSALHAGKSEQVRVTIATSKTLEPGTYPIDITVIGYDTFGAEYKTTASAYLTVTASNDFSEESPRIVIDSYEMIPGDAQPGDEVSLKLRVRNLGTTDAKNVEVSLSEYDLTLLSLREVLPKKTVASLATDETAEVVFAAQLSSVFPTEKTVPVTVGFAFNGANGGYYMDSATVNLAVKEPATTEFKEHSPRLVVDQCTMSPSSAQPGDTVTLTLKIRNIGYDTARNAKISLTDFDASHLELREVTGVKTVEKLEYDQVETVKFSAKLTSLMPQDVPEAVGVSFVFGDTFGGSYEDKTTVYITSKSPEDKPEDDQLSKPQIIVDSFSFDVESVQAGTAFKLVFDLKNTSKTTAVKNIKVSIQNEAGSSVFTPVDASNSFYIEEIGMQDTYRCEISLMPKKDAESKIYPLILNMYYEDAKNNPYNTDESIGISVNQPVRLEISNLWYQETVAAGEMFNVSFQYNNKSRSPIYFLAIDMKGAGSFMNGKEEIGSLPSGYSDYFDGNVVAGEETGRQEFILTFLFEDASGREMTIEEKFYVEVTEPMSFEDPGMYEDFPADPGLMEDPSVSTMTEKDGITVFGIPLWIVLVAGGAVLAVAIVVTVIVCVRRKAKKAEDEDADL